MSDFDFVRQQLIDALDSLFVDDEIYDEFRHMRNLLFISRANDHFDELYMIVKQRYADFLRSSDLVR